jgi:hypothetical protein
MYVMHKDKYTTAQEHMANKNVHYVFSKQNHLYRGDKKKSLIRTA